jgi:hydroxymethylbilane synthase
VVLAAAGLARLGRTASITEVLPPAVMLPAPAQGALAVECRANDENAWYAAALHGVDDRATRAAAIAERSLLATLEAGCIAPVGAYATVNDGTLALAGAVVAVDGTARVFGESWGAIGDATELGRELALELLSRGAGALLGAAR